MNTKVEEALAVIASGVADRDVRIAWPGESIAELDNAGKTLARHIAQQDATIARLTELVRAVKSSDYEISCDDVSTGNWFDARTALIAALNQEQGK